MRIGLHSFLSGVETFLLFSTISSAFTQNSYVDTDLVDPLQPVWDTLDRIPSDVSEKVIQGIGRQLQLANGQMDRNIRLLTNPLTDILSALHRLQHTVTSGVAINDTVNTLLESYQSRFLNDLTEAVTKLERHMDTRIQELETKLKIHIDSKFVSGSSNRQAATNSGSEEVPLAQTLRDNTATLENINTHVLKLTEKLGGSSSDGDSCSTLVDKVSELMAGSGGKGVCPIVNQRGLYGLPRDCSDKHWQQPEASSGVYEIFPTLDPKDPVNCFCDMGQSNAKETGGWTVILRRRNSTFGLVNFNRTWDEYRRGFGDPGEGEWWFGLSALHALTYRQPFEVDLLIHDIERGTYHATYTTFRLEDESHNYKLILNGFTGNLTHDALTSKHNGSPFSTYDRDNDFWSGNCAMSNGGGWWFNKCHYTTLTAPFPTSNDRNAKTIRWLEDDWLVLDDVTMKIRPFNYAERFNVHSAA